MPLATEPSMQSPEAHTTEKSWQGAGDDGAKNRGGLAMLCGGSGLRRADLPGLEISPATAQPFGARRPRPYRGTRSRD